MIFSATSLDGVFILEPELMRDERGFFARTFCTKDFADRGLPAPVAQCSISFNARKGTLRGMHFQGMPHVEDKLVRCTAGAIFDVAVDLRRQSSSFGHWFGLELSAQNRQALFIPKGFAHGFLTLAEASEVLYMISVPFVPGFGRGFRWDDPTVNIAWPAPPSVIADRDAAFPLLAELSEGEVE